MHSILNIPTTLALVSSCWNVAEQQLRRSIEEKHHDVDEEFITQFFYGEFAFAVQDASDKGKVRDAFLTDLMNAFPDFAESSELVGIATGLIADVTLHERKIERFTGGDMGLTIVRPQVSQHPFDETEFSIEEYCRGLLSQAKIKRRSGKWGTFKKNQKQVLQGRTMFLGLLLYSYSDAERRKLNEFNWQLCEGESIDTVQEWLKVNQFPTLINSSRIIELLGNGAIGTDDRDTIDQVIRPKTRPSMTIRIYWPPTERPSSTIHAYSFQRTEEKQKVYVHVLER
jgi:hypothetical protein